MRREDFDHVILAAANVVGDDLVVIGSQAVLGQYRDAPPQLLVSLEVDVYPRSEPERAGEIDAVLGDGSMFHETYGYYAHGVGPETASAPAGWEDRLVRLDLPAMRPRTGTVTAWCLEIHDLILAKLAAGRPHDLTFAEDALRAGLADPTQLALGAELLPDSARDAARVRLEGLLAYLRRDSLQQVEDGKSGR
jgi:hypothetical protein